jgi:hypothetical protein
MKPMEIPTWACLEARIGRIVIQSREDDRIADLAKVMERNYTDALKRLQEAINRSIYGG